MCYEEPRFIDEVDDGRSFMDYAQIIICVLIFALLGYVVFRSTRTQKEQEIENRPIGNTKGDALRERCEKEGLDLQKVLAMVKADSFDTITEYNHAVLNKNWEKMKERCKSE